MDAMQGVRKLLEYLTPLGQKRDVSESDEQTGEASGSEVAHRHLCLSCIAVNLSLWKFLPASTSLCLFQGLSLYAPRHYFLPPRMALLQVSAIIK